MNYATTANFLPLYSPATSSGQALNQSSAKMLVSWNPISKLVLLSLMDSLSSVGAFEANWDGQGSKKPDALAVARAKILIEDVYNQVESLSYSTGDIWFSPHISASGEGEIVFEWWKDEFKLTIYVGSTGSEYIKVWGSDIFTQMEDGVLAGSQFQGLWLWLNS
ncbi:hypothetical protein [Undibacterium sp.]|uniref:hypothetical protein n=1 Tax=Undibacterium sp. TaxID=1914977 RepID=UPI00374DB023